MATYLRDYGHLSLRRLRLPLKVTERSPVVLAQGRRIGAALFQSSNAPTKVHGLNHDLDYGDGVVCDASTIAAHDDARCQGCVFRVGESNTIMPKAQEWSSLDKKSRRKAT
jgi:hypothetical protein